MELCHQVIKLSTSHAVFTTLATIRYLLPKTLRVLLKPRITMICSIILMPGRNSSENLPMLRAEITVKSLESKTESQPSSSRKLRHLVSRINLRKKSLPPSKERHTLKLQPILTSTSVSIRTKLART